MILYRARSIGSRPRRLPQFEGNEPYVRAKGRWFTSVQADAVAYGQSTFNPGHWELISIEVPDAIVDSFRVATTPYTVDGLAPGDYADKPETEYLVQTFRTLAAVTIAMPVVGGMRVRDYIDVSAPRSAAMIRHAEDLGIPVKDLPLAA